MDKRTKWRKEKNLSLVKGKETSENTMLAVKRLIRNKSIRLTQCENELLRMKLDLLRKDFCFTRPLFPQVLMQRPCFRFKNQLGATSKNVQLSKGVPVRLMNPYFLSHSIVKGCNLSEVPCNCFDVRFHHRASVHDRASSQKDPDVFVPSHEPTKSSGMDKNYC